jgi:hypothetical protein
VFCIPELLALYVFVLCYVLVTRFMFLLFVLYLFYCFVCFALYFVCSVFLYCFVYCFSLCIMLFLLICVHVYGPLSPGGNPIAVTNYHIITFLNG